MKYLKRPKVAVPSKKIAAHKVFYEQMQEKKEELKNATVSQASTTI